MIETKDIRQIRKSLGLSQVGLGRALALGEGAAGTVCRWENGDRQPDGMALAFIELLRDSPEARRLRGIADRS